MFSSGSKAGLALAQGVALPFQVTEFDRKDKRPAHYARGAAQLAAHVAVSEAGLVVRSSVQESRQVDQKSQTIKARTKKVRLALGRNSGAIFQRQRRGVPQSVDRSRFQVARSSRNCCDCKAPVEGFPRKLRERLERFGEA